MSSARRKATASAYLAVMLKILVIFVVVFTRDGEKPAPSKPTFFMIEHAFADDVDIAHQNESSTLRPEVGGALITLLSTHDLNLDVTVFGINDTQAIARAATVAQLLRSSGIPSSSLRVIGSWSSETGTGNGQQISNGILATKRNI